MNYKRDNYTLHENITHPFPRQLNDGRFQIREIDNEIYLT